MRGDRSGLLPRTRDEAKFKEEHPSQRSGALLRIYHQLQIKYHAEGMPSPFMTTLKRRATRGCLEIPVLPP